MSRRRAHKMTPQETRLAGLCLYHEQFARERYVKAAALIPPPRTAVQYAGPGGVRVRMR